MLVTNGDAVQNLLIGELADVVEAVKQLPSLEQSGENLGHFNFLAEMGAESVGNNRVFILILNLGFGCRGGVGGSWRNAALNARRFFGYGLKQHDSSAG